jgi:hypothetical protein
MTRMIGSLLVATTLLVGACGASFEAAPPPGFVELEEEDGAYAHRALSADGLVIAVREIEHEPKGELAFWVRAIENRMRQRGGYALLDTRDVSCWSGQQGKQLRFGHDEGDQPHLYTVTVFVTDDYIYVLEAGGSKELMEKHAAEIEQAITGFVIK